MERLIIFKIFHCHKIIIKFYKILKMITAIKIIMKSYKTYVIQENNPLNK
jgi:hypothetical protein